MSRIALEEAAVEADRPRRGHRLAAIGWTGHAAGIEIGKMSHQSTPVHDTTIKHSTWLTRIVAIGRELTREGQPGVGPLLVPVQRFPCSVRSLGELPLSPGAIKTPLTPNLNQNFMIF